MNKAHKIIPLSRGQFTLVDTRDFDWLNKRKWHAVKDHSTKSGNYYAANKTVKGGIRKTISMHRFILNPLKNIPVDHINGYGLDNRRANIRLCTPSQNQWNQKPKKGTSRYKGVHRSTGDDKWTAQANAFGKKFYLGRFISEEEAGKAYDSFAKKNFGEFARLNFPEQEQTNEGK